MLKQVVEIRIRAKVLEQSQYTTGERLFDLIEIATEVLRKLRIACNPKIYTEMMTIRLAEGQEKQNYHPI